MAGTISTKSDLLRAMDEGRAEVFSFPPPGFDDPDRDRLILSKGHAAAALYSTLAIGGYLPAEQLSTFMQPMSQLNGHPANTKIAAVEASTGPLGHGLPIAVGAALAARLDGSDRRVFVICGDGEMQEGSNWEAIMTAAHHELSNLCLVIDRNMLQQGARVELAAHHFRVFLVRDAPPHVDREVAIRAALAAVREVDVEAEHRSLSSEKSGAL